MSQILNGHRIGWLVDSLFVSAIQLGQAIDNHAKLSYIIFWGDCDKA